MKYIKTYEGLGEISGVLKTGGEFFSKLFANKYIKKLVSKTNKLISSNEKLIMVRDFFEWIYPDKSEAILYLDDHTFRERKKIFLYFKMEGKYNNWLEVKIRKDNTIEELMYLEQLLIEYGEIISDRQFELFRIYYLTIDNADIFITKLSLDEYELSKAAKKYNL